MTKKSFKNISKSFERMKRTISNRWGLPEDLVGSVLFLSSEYSSYINGATLDVDGGWTVKGI